MRAGHSMVPEAQLWHATVKQLETARNDSEQQRRDVAAEKDAEVDRWRETTRTMQWNKDVAEAKLREVEFEATCRVNEIQWASVRQATEYEDRIRALEELLAEERRAHQEDRQRLEELARKACAEADARVEEAERRCRAAVAAADARSREAVECMEKALHRSAEDVELARRREESNIDVARSEADARVRDAEEHFRNELEARHRQVIERQRAMEETLYLHGRPKSEGLHEARQHLAVGAVVADQDPKELRLVQAADLATKDGRTGAQKELFELEKALHSRTADRIASRLAQTSSREGDPSRWQDLGTRSRPRHWHDLVAT